MHHIGYNADCVNTWEWNKVDPMIRLEALFMARTKTETVEIQMDSKVKRQLDKFCAQVGMSTAVAVNMFARVVLREKRLPFEITTETDPFYSESNMAHLRQGITALNNGEGVEFNPLEASE